MEKKILFLTRLRKRNEIYFYTALYLTHHGIIKFCNHLTISGSLQSNFSIAKIKMAKNIYIIRRLNGTTDFKKIISQRGPGGGSRRGGLQHSGNGGPCQA
jgi:hypothetical protein